MGRTIRTCNLGLSLLLLSALPTAAFAAKEKDESQIVHAYVNARLAELGNRDDEALKVYLKLHKLAPDSETLSDRLLTSAIRAGDMPSAVRAVRALELKKAETSEGPLLLFADAYKRKNWPMASLAITELESESRFAFMAPILRAWVDVAQAKPFTLDQPDPKTDPFLAYYAADQRTYLDLAARNYATAKPYLRAIALSDADFGDDLLIRAAPIYAALGDGDFSAALVKNVTESDYATALGKIGANAPLARLSADEGLAMLHMRIAHTLVDQDNGEEALVFARIAQWLAPNNQAVQLTLADALATQGLGNGADALRAAIPVSSPYWPRAIAGRSKAYAAEDRLAAAVKLADDASRQKPRSANIAILKAQYQVQAGNYADAISVFRKLVSEADDARLDGRPRASYRLLLATALDKSGDWAGAREQLEQASKLDPDNSSILNYLGYVLLEKGDDVQGAADMIARAYKLSPQSVAITDSMGWAKYHQRKYDEAVGYLERAARGSGADPTINEHLGDAYWRAGRLVDARYAWRVAAHTAEDATAARLALKLDIGLPEAASKN